VLGAGERVRLVGTSARPVVAVARDADAAREVSVGSGNGGRFDVDVDVGRSGWVVVELSC
jgi:hypothetical protein